MKRIVLSVAIVLFSIPLFSQEKMIIAILDLDPKGVSRIAANSATNVIRSEFVNIGNFTVVERAAMDEILKEQELQMTGCTDQSCAVKVGKLLSARKIIVGEINRVGQAVMLTLRIIDVEKGQSEYSARQKAKSIEDIDEAAVKIARNLTQRIVSGEKEFFTPQTPLGYFSRSLIPGWGQAYAGEPLKGVAFGGMFLLSGIVFYFQYSNMVDKENAYNYEPLHSDKFSQRRSDYEDAVLYCNISLGVVALAYVVHWVDAIFFSRPDFGTRSDKSVSIESGFSVHISSRPVQGLEYSETSLGLELQYRF